MTNVRRKYFISNRQLLHSSKGFSLIELLVSVGIFGIIGTGTLAAVTTSFRTVATEQRLTEASDGARMALGMMATELRQASALSPYFPGTDLSLLECDSKLEVTSSSVQFIVVHDDEYSSNGYQAYLIGYQYDPSTEEIVRGEVALSNFSDCSVVSGDPFDPYVTTVIAERVIPVDSDGDGANEPIFSLGGKILSITFGTAVNSPKKTFSIQQLRTTVQLRNHVT